MGEINYNDCNFHAFSPLLHLVLESNSIVPLIAGCMVGNKQSPSAIAITCQLMSENKIHPIKNKTRTFNSNDHGGYSK